MGVRPKVVITWPISQTALNKLQSQFEVIMNPHEQVLTPDQLLQFAAGADAILCILTNKITSQVLDAAGPQLKIVASMSMGFDHIDVPAATAKNVVVTNTPGTTDEAVAEHAIALMLALAKCIPACDAFVRSGKYHGWDPTIFVGPQLGGKVLGIVGVGHIGSTIARIAGFGFGMAIAYNDVRPNSELEQRYNARLFDIDQLLSVADFVTIHVPLLPSTTHLINAQRLAKMKPTSYLINTSRGPVVDEAALIVALQNRQIAGAALDVYEHEPTIPPQLLQLPNVILTPHTASATYEARVAMAERAVANIIAVLSGQTAPDMVKAG